MGRLCAYLVSPSPPRPPEHLGDVGPVRQDYSAEQVPHLGHRQREERRRRGAARIPLFRGAAWLRTAARNAWAKSASVM
jgi:hypothetical protein